MPISRPSVADDNTLTERVRGLRSAGWSRQAISDALNAEGVPTGPWRGAVEAVVPSGRRRVRAAEEATEGRPTEWWAAPIIVSHSHR